MTDVLTDLGYTVAACDRRALRAREAGLRRDDSQGPVATRCGLKLCRKDGDVHEDHKTKKNLLVERDSERLTANADVVHDTITLRSYRLVGQSATGVSDCTMGGQCPRSLG